MLTYFEILQVYFGPFRLVGYVSFRVVAAALTAFLLMMVIMPRLIRWLRLKKYGEQGGKGDGAIVVDHMRQAKAGTPTMGGLGLIACVILTALLWCQPQEPRTWLLIATALGYAGLGFLDDRTKIFKGAEGMSKGVKMLLQLALGIGLGMWFWHIDSAVIIEGLTTITGGPVEVRQPTDTSTVTNALTIPFLSLDYALPIGFGIVIWTLIMTFACSNSVNFTDGMDGLASGVMLIASIAFLIVAYIASNFITAHHLGVFYVAGCSEVAVICAAIAGACLGFLWFNSSPAEVFMGDTGSQSLGGLLAMISMCCKQEFMILLVGFVFFMEGASVMMQVGYFKLTGGKRIFLCAPIHHHFQYKGWPETKIVGRFWIIAAITAFMALATLKLR